MVEIVGNNGNDILLSSPFSDEIDGRGGFDLVDYKFATEGINARLGILTEVNGEIVVIGHGSASGIKSGVVQHDVLFRVEGLLGSDAKDLLLGDDQDNLLSGRSGNDTLSGFGGKDHLGGGLDNDILSGGFGDDRLVGGMGNDTLTGGVGADRFEFASFTEGTDTITDFTIANDTIQIKASDFGGGLILGAISADQFHLGSGATDSSDRFIYSRTGDLFFDADGSGTAFAQVKLATLTDAPLIAAANIVAF